MALKFGEGYVPIYLTGMDAFKSGLASAHRTLTTSIHRMDAVARQAKFGLLIAGAATAGALKIGGGFEQGMARVKALTGATGESFNALETQALTLGRTTVFTARQSAEAMSYFALAGFDANKIMAAMPATLNVAAAGQMDVAQAADITAKVMAGMGLEAKDLNHTMDVLTKAFTSSNTTLSQLGEAFRYVGPVAKTAGVELEEVTALLMAVSNAGIQASQAGTTLRGALARMAAQPKELKDVFEGLGVAITDASGGLRPLADIFDDLNRAMEPLGEMDRMGRMMTAFGMRAGPGMLELLSVGGDAIRDMQAKLKDAGGTAQRVADVPLDTLFGSLKLLWSAFEGIDNAISKELSPKLRKFVDHLRDMASAIAKGDSATVKQTLHLLEMGVRWSTLAVLIPVVLRSMRLVVGVMMAMTTQAALASGGLTLLAGGIALLLQTFVQSRLTGEGFGTTLSNNTKALFGLKSGAEDAAEAIKKLNREEKLAVAREKWGRTKGEGEPSGEEKPRMVLSPKAQRRADDLTNAIKATHAKAKAWAKAAKDAAQKAREAPAGFQQRTYLNERQAAVERAQQLKGELGLLAKALQDVRATAAPEVEIPETVRDLIAEMIGEPGLAVAPEQQGGRFGSWQPSAKLPTPYQRTGPQTIELSLEDFKKAFQKFGKKVEGAIPTEIVTQEGGGQRQYIYVPEPKKEEPWQPQFMGLIEFWKTTQQGISQDIPKKQLDEIKGLRVDVQELRKWLLQGLA